MKPLSAPQLLLPTGLALGLMACDPSVVIGARWNLTESGAEAGAGGEPSSPEAWCAVAPWVNAPVVFASANGSDIPPGQYLLTYVSGAQIHDAATGYEVTGHYYGKSSLEAGHHVFSGDSVGSGGTNLWLDEKGLLEGGSSIAAVENANRGHTWPLPHTGGELRITLYDDYYDDNKGPGSRFCITRAP